MSGGLCVFACKNKSIFLDVSIQGGEYSGNFEVNATLNQIIYDLKPGSFELKVKGDNACGFKERDSTFDLEEKEV